MLKKNMYKHFENSTMYRKYLKNSKYFENVIAYYIKIYNTYMKILIISLHEVHIFLIKYC